MDIKNIDLKNSNSKFEVAQKLVELAINPESKSIFRNVGNYKEILSEIELLQKNLLLSKSGNDNKVALDNLNEKTEMIKNYGEILSIVDLKLVDIVTNDKELTQENKTNIMQEHIYSVRVVRADCLMIEERNNKILEIFKYKKEDKSALNSKIKDIRNGSINATSNKLKNN